MVTQDNHDGSVRAYEAKDGSLHRNPVDRDICDQVREVRLLRDKVAGELQGVAPFSEDFRCNGMFEEWHFTDGIQHLLANDLDGLANLVEAARKLDRLRKIKTDSTTS